MAQPFNYMIPSPQDAFQSSFAFGQQIAAQQKAQQQAQQKAIEAQQARAAMQMVYDNPTPENISKFYMAYPAYKEQFEAARQPLTDAAKADDLDFTSRALSLLTNGATDQANALMQSRIAALKETPGREAEAARTEAVAQMIAKEPQAGKALLNMKMAAIDSKLYETIFGKTADKTAFQQDFEYIKKTFGPSAAAEYAQYGRSGTVSIPLGNGQTYVGPPSMAPGASRWTEMSGESGQAPPSGSEQAPPMDGSGVETILRNASGSKTVTKQEADVVRQSLGKNGQAAFNNWLKQNQIRVIVRTGKAADGRRVVKYQDGAVEYGD
jgi:hypothetical protein